MQKINIAAIEENKQSENQVRQLHDFIFFNTAGKNRILGTGSVVKRELKGAILQLKPILDRTCYVGHGIHRKN